MTMTHVVRLIFTLEPEGAWYCNECQDWSGQPEEHAATVHGVTDPDDMILVDTEDI